MVKPSGNYEKPYLYKVKCDVRKTWERVVHVVVSKDFSNRYQQLCK